MMKAGLYARVSRDDQKSLNQLIELREYAARRGFETQEFIDEGLSGSLAQDKRPELKKLMEAARLRKIDLIICWRLDRFARSLKQLVDMIGELETWNVGFTTLRENIDTTTPSGRLVFHIFAALAEFERSLIIERTNLGLKRALAQGKTLGRRPLAIDTILIDRLKDEGRSLRQIQRLTGYSRMTVARRLSHNRPQNSLLVHDGNAN